LAFYKTVFRNLDHQQSLLTMPQNDNLYKVLEAKFMEVAERPAFMMPDAGALAHDALTYDALTYGALAEGVARMAGALRGLGVRPDDRVMVQVEKSIDNVMLYLAVLKLGAIYNPLNTAYTARELDYFIGDAEPVLVVVTPARLAAVQSIADKCSIANKCNRPAVTTLDADGSGSLADLARTAQPVRETAPRRADDLAALIYTSGTTGRSKGAMLSHDNLLSNAMVLHDYWGFIEGDVLLHALPIFHVHGLFIALHTAFLNGSSIFWLPKFDADAVMALLPRATVMMGVPTFYTRLLARQEFGRAMCRNMRLFISGSAPLLAETHVEFEARTQCKILERYGMTEAGMITSNPYKDAERIAGTVGYALPGVEARVADEDGKILRPDKVGVLEVKGRNIFSGYWRNLEKTKEEFRDDGYFITGDLAQMAADGRIRIVGRAKDLIITGGLNVYPKEVEEELNALDGIKESAVIGVPHSDFGEGVIAVIVACSKSGSGSGSGSETGTGSETDSDSGTAAAPGDEGDIIAALAERLAKFKLPKRIFTAKELPRNAMGKVQKNELRTRFAGTFAD